MATAPPKDLSRLVTPNRVLAAAGITVKGVLPEVTTCPGCRHEKLTIYLDPTAVDANRWMFCHHCGFHGDSLELYSLVRRTSSINESIERASMDGTCNLELHEFTPEAVVNYIQYFPGRRKKTETIWKHLRAGLGRRLHPELSRRMQEMHLWSTWNYGQGLIGRFMGGAMRKEVNRLFDEDVVPRQGFKTVLAFNYQDVPGRTVGFQLIGETDRRFKPCQYNYGARSEGGLAMLDLLNAFEDTVYAVSDPILAMHLHRRHLVDSNEPLKMVVYNDTTSSAWESVKARQVILWAPRIDYRIFNQARSVEHGCITDHPHIRDVDNESIYNYVSKRSSHEIVHLMAKHARPWHEYFISWATDDRRPEYELRETVKQLSFNQRERELLLESAPRAVRARLEHFLTEIPHEGRAVTVNKTKIMDRATGWYAVTGLKHEELILDAPVRLYREITDVPTATIYWHGALQYKTKVVEFVEDVSVIEKNPNLWLREVMARAGVGMATFNPGWSKHFVYLVKNFNDPKRITLSNQMGIQDDGDLLFPLFRVRDGKVIEEDTYLDPRRTPGITIKPPVKREARPEDVMFPARTAVIAGFAALVYNWLLSLRDEPACPVAFVGPPGSIANSAVRHLHKVMGLDKREVRYHWRDALQVIEDLRYTGFPTFVEPQNYGLIKNFPNPFRAFCLLQAERSEATALACGGPWIRVYAPNLRSEHKPLPPVDDMVNYLIDLQRRQYDLSDGDLFEAVVRDIAAWYHGYLGNQEELLSALKATILPPLLPGDGVIELICWLHQSGRLEVSREELATRIVDGTVYDRYHKKKIAVVYGTPEKAVYVSRAVLSSVLQTDKLPLPDFSRATDDLASRHLLLDTYDTPDGWLISRDHWDARVAAWKQL